MKKSILLLLPIIISFQAAAYPEHISKQHPVEVNTSEDFTLKNDLQNTKNLKNIYENLSDTQKIQFFYYLKMYNDAAYKLFNISSDKNVIVFNDVLQDKLTIDNIYLDYVFNEQYSKFIKSYFSIQSVIKYEDPELFNKNLENSQKINEEGNKEDSYYAHMGNIKNKIINLVKDDKKMSDVEKFINNTSTQEKETFKNSIDKEHLNVQYGYTKILIEKYKNSNNEESQKILKKLNNKTAD